MNVTVPQKCNKMNQDIQRKIITALATFTPTLSTYRNDSGSCKQFGRLSCSVNKKNEAKA